MKKILSLMIAVWTIFSLCPAAVSAEDAIAPSAQSAILMEAGGTVIAEKNADARLPMASTTKIMTALVALERVPH